MSFILFFTGTFISITAAENMESITLADKNKIITKEYLEEKYKELAQVVKTKINCLEFSSVYTQAKNLKVLELG